LKDVTDFLRPAKEGLVELLVLGLEGLELMDEAESTEGFLSQCSVDRLREDLCEITEPKMLQWERDPSYPP